MRNSKKYIEHLIRLEYLNSEEKEDVLEVCDKFHIFLKPGDLLTFHNSVKYEIRTKDENPTYTKSYRFTHIRKVEVHKQTEKMLEENIIRPSVSPYFLQFGLFQKKKDENGSGFPNITDVLDKLGRCNYFTTLDSLSGFLQIEVP